MSVLINKDTRVLVQGITGSQGFFHSKQMLKYGTKIVAGCTPGKGGKEVEGMPVFNTVEEAKEEEGVDSSIIFVPPPFAADAVLEALDAEIDLVICITEGIPVRDMIKVKEVLAKSKSRLIGPNCPGVITPEECKMGIMPGFIHKKGSVGVVSRSGTLSYEVVAQLTELGIGQSTCIGIGGDSILGTNHKQAVKLFNEDPDTEAIVMIGEIGGSTEEEAGDYIKEQVDKPVVAFIAGQTAPKGKRMGHAGAIVAGKASTAESKMAYLEECGIAISKSPAEIGRTLQKVIS